MKKIQQLALISAIALTGAVGFTACSSSDDVSQDVSNPNFNPQTNEVLAKFVFNVSTGNSTTRQTSAATQAAVSETFRGIDNAVLFSFKQGSDGKTIATAVQQTSALTCHVSSLLEALVKTRPAV